jgi:L-amino acid N-acyltransferase YncA
VSPSLQEHLHIRDAIPGDAEGIVKILNPIIAARIYTVLDTQISVEAERDFILRFPDRGVFHVAVDRRTSRLVGFQNMEPIASYSHSFDHVGGMGTYVDLDCRRQGVAASLFEATFAAAVRKGYEKAFTFVRADNPAALETYLRYGFRVIGHAEKHARIDGRYVDEVLIEKLF